MKIILYVTMYTFLWRTSSRADSTDSDNKYDLFENMQLERTAFGFKKITAWDFRDLKSPYSLTLSNNITLKRQYAINTVFKLYEVKSWCIFSIVNPQGKTKLSVCITPVNMQIVKISIEGLIEKDIDFFHEMEVKDNWITIQIFVNENLVSHRVNCTNNLDKAEIPEKDVVLSTEDQVLIGKSNSASNSGSFQAIVEEITIYSPSDDSTLATICDQVPSFESSDLNDYDTDIFGGPGKFDKGDVGEKGDKGDQGDRGDKGDKGEKGDKGGVGIQGDKGEKGEKGQKGYKGDQGNAIKGPEGPIGPIGPAGLKGPPGNMGPEGVCSCSEELVSHLLLSMPKMRGPPGDKGPPGLNGTTGTPGDIGPVGPKGEPGLNGAKGETGERGYYGRPGKDGKEGPKGEPGKDGVPGERGPRGETGDPGKPGGTVMGPIGPKGEPGKDGNKGEKGDPGKDGSNGIPGNHGIDGKKGDKGDKGEAGLNGMLGKAGTPGKDGQKGDMGERGFKGDKGAPGLPGLSPTWVSLLDETLNPEANATIVKILKDYKGDKGDKAEKGQKGERGDKGDVGTAGIDGKDGSPGKRGDIGPKGDIGPIGPIGLKGDRGEPGLPGSVPASEIALSKGSKGDRGDPGRIGNRGPRGFTGIKGASGPKGPMGIKGDKGSTGSVGPVGPPGKDGIPGTKGEKGAPPDIDLLKFKGEKGDKGNDGIKGEPGVPGPQGPIGLPGTSAPESFPVIGSPGPPGPPGPPGQPGTSIIGPKGEPGKLSLDSFDSEDFYITSTVVFRNKHLLLAQKSTTLQIGTLAYVIQERILLVKVEDGWQYVKSGRYYIRNNAFIGQENRLVTKPIDDVKQYSTTLKPRFKHREQRCLKLVALNHPYSGKVHRAHDDIAGYSVVADKCFKQKSAAKLPGTYEPFLTSRIRDLNALVPETLRHLPVMNLKNEMLFESWNSMFNGSDGVFNKSEFNLYSFNGKIANKDSTWRNRIVWHGSEARGVRSSYDCDEWSSDQKNLYGYASRLDSGKLLERARYPCWKSFIILCVEINSDICIKNPLQRRRYWRKNHRRPYY